MSIITSTAADAVPDLFLPGMVRGGQLCGSDHGTGGQPRIFKRSGLSNLRRGNARGSVAAGTGFRQSGAAVFPGDAAVYPGGADRRLDSGEGVPYSVVGLYR